MTIAKNEVIELMKDLPDPLEIEELMYRLYLREKWEEGEADIAAGQTFTLEEIRAQVASWRP